MVRIVFMALVLFFPMTAMGTMVEIAAFNYPPVVSQDAPGGGLVEQIVSASFKESKLETHINYFPPARVLKQHVGGDEYAACLGPVILAERQAREKKDKSEKEVLLWPK